MHVSFSNESSEFGSLWCGGDLEYHAVAVMHQDAAVGFVELLFLSDFQNKNTREIKSKVNTKRTTNTIELL